MNNKIFLCLSGIVLGLILAGVLHFAITDSRPVSVRTYADSLRDRVKLIEDDEHGLLRIFIDGKEVARLSSEELHLETSVTALGFRPVQMPMSTPAPDNEGGETP